MFLVRGIARNITRATSGIKSPEIYLLSDWKIEAADVYQQSSRFLVAVTSDNLCLLMARSRPSVNLLPETPIVCKIKFLLPIPKNLSIHIADIPKLEIFNPEVCENKVFLPIPKISTFSESRILQPVVLNYINWLFERGICSKNYIETFSSTKTFKYREIVEFIPKVSRNLFPSLKEPKISGRYFEQNKKQENDLHKEGKSVTKRRLDRDKISTRSLSQWELLQPILLPPLSLEFPKEIDFYRELRGYQKQGIAWLADNSSALLADEMGTGKTVQTVNALRLLFRQGKIRSSLVVCPLAVIGSIDLTIETGSSEGWIGHFYHWASKELEVAVIRGGSRDQRKLDWERPLHVYITNYETLRIDISNQILTDRTKFDCIILDEAQKIKNKDTKISQAIRWLQPQYRWALTGTPVENSVDDVKSLFDFIRPGTFKGNTKDSPQTVQALIDPYMLRRLKRDVLHDLPNKIRQEDWLELDEFQEKDYKRVLKTGTEKIETSLGVEKITQVQQHIFALLGELKQICNFAKGHSKSPKTERLLEHIENIAANNQKVLVFSQYRKEGINKIADFLDRKKIQYVCYVGGSDQQKRQAVSNFRSNPDITVFLATIQAAGYGITLTEAAYVIHFDHPWNPAKMQNAEDRTHRIGQKSSVTVYSFWMKGTIEERIKKKLKEKRLLVESTVNELAVETIEDGLSTKDWLDIFGIKPTVKTIQVEAKSKSEPNFRESSQKGENSKASLIKEAMDGSIQPFKAIVGANDMFNERLRKVEKNIELLRKQISGKEEAKIMAPFDDKARIDLGIQKLREEMRPFEEKYWRLLAERSTQIEISEPEAEVVVAELVEQVGQLKTSTQYPDEVLQLLQKIYIEVSKPSTPATAKLKGALSMFPPFVSLGYEVEIDTEGFFRTHLPTFTQWYKALAEK